MSKIKKKKDYEYRTYQFRIKPNNLLFPYCDEMCFNSKNLYNVGNFYIRQAFSGLRKEKSLRHENEVEVINTICESIELLNKIKSETFIKRKDYLNSKHEETPNFFEKPTGLKSFISYSLLEGVLKLTKQSDYISLPAQTNQAVLRLLNQDWSSFFASIEEYNINPGKFKGRPKTPRYANKNGRKVATFTNQSCKLRTDGTTSYLTFPKTKLTLDLGGFKPKSTDLKSVRIVPNAHFYTVEIIVAVPKAVVTEISSRIIAIDLGINNFATIVNNVGLTPIIIKGGILKSKNQFYNKQRAKYYSILRLGKSSTQGTFTSGRLDNLDINRYSFIKDYFHKSSKLIVTYRLKNQIDTIVVGKNKGWKDNLLMRKDCKLNFTSIPYNLFIQILTYKSNEAGIKVIVTEESYTSKASFIDGDFIPTYGIDDGKAVFSGKRISRGMYKSKVGILINADVNGAYNILRKVFPTACSDINIKDSGVVNTPKTLLVA